MQHSRSAFRILLLLTLLWMGVIFWFSSRNAEDSGAFSLGLLQGILRVIIPHWEKRSADEQQAIIDAVHTLFRKCGHFSEYGVLGLLLKLTVRRSPKPNPSCRQQHPVLTGFALPALLVLLYACTDEFHQRFVPGRSCELRDVCIDTAGACCGILFCMLVTGLLRKKKVSPTDT